MKDIQVGDIICGTNNSKQIVLGVFPKPEQKLYNVYFEDGQVVECSSEHLWTVTNYRGTKKTLPAKKMKDDYVVKNKKYNRYKFRLSAHVSLLLKYFYNCS